MKRSTANRKSSPTATTAAILSLVLLLGGCSGMRIVDSDVNAFSTVAPGAVTLPVRYRFERLPSQQAQPSQTAALEALAQPVLAQAGLVRDDAAAAYSVQLDLRIFRDPQAPWDDPRYVNGFVIAHPVPGRYGMHMYYPSMTMNFDYPYYRRDLSVLVRRLSDAQVVFESRAKHDGRWNDDDAVLPAMLQAALQGFPAPPAGLRRVVIEIPR
jgi:hypothetical protein